MFDTDGANLFGNAYADAVVFLLTRVSLLECDRQLNIVTKNFCLWISTNARLATLRIKITGFNRHMLGSLQSFVCNLQSVYFSSCNHTGT